MQGNRFASVLLVVMLVFGLLLAACSGNSNSGNASGNTEGNTSPPPAETQQPAQTQQPEPEEQHDPVTLKLITWNTAYQELYDKFNAKYPWITIEPIMPKSANETDIIEVIASLEAAGTPADLTWLIDQGPYIENNLLEDLRPYMDADESLKEVKLPDGFFESLELNGKRYAIPFVDVPMWVVVNKDLLHKYGLEMPANDWTYEDFRKMAAAATDPAAGEFGLTNNGIFGSHFLSAMAIANGHADNHSYMNADLTQSVMHTPGVLDDVRWMREFVTKDGSLPGNKKAEELGGTVGSFISGKTLFDVGGDWILPALKKDAKFDWDVVPFPKGSVTQATFRIYGPLALLSGSKNKDAAYKWISFQFTEEAQKWKIDQGANASVVSDALNNYIDQSPIWEGKNTSAVKYTKDMCCSIVGPTIPAFSENPWQDFTGVVMDGADPNLLIPKVEAWNKKTVEMRAQRGF